MKIVQRKYLGGNVWETLTSGHVEGESCNIVIGFGEASILRNSEVFDALRADYPAAEIILCSTAGEICDTRVHESSLSLVGVRLERSSVSTACVNIGDYVDSYQAGCELASQLPQAGLKSVLIFSDGHLVNGSELITAINDSLPPGTVVGGGMAGDGAHFQATLVGLNQVPAEGRVAAVGFYGKNLCLTSGSVGGWDPFGVERLITRSAKNVLFELDGKAALDVYKLYLGEYADELPAAGLFFPLAIRIPGSTEPLVRTILAVDEKDKSLTFAGNMPEGAYAQLMKANHDRLIDGAGLAAEQSIGAGTKSPDLAILVSCVGRKLVLGQRVEEEVEIVRSVYGEKTILSGFYSYGEFAPPAIAAPCELHNQTMTIWAMSEG